jgi:hypothetical protein
MVKSEADVMMEGTTTAHFSGLHFEDEYPVQQHTGQNKVPFVIGTFTIERGLGKGIASSSSQYSMECNVVEWSGGE